MIYMQTIRGYPYMTQQKIAEEFQISRGTVRSRLKEIQSEIQKGRYSDYAIVDDGNLVLVNALVFLDYLTFRRRLLEKNARKYVPPFQPDEIMKISGWSANSVKMGGAENWNCYQQEIG